MGNQARDLILTNFLTGLHHLALPAVFSTSWASRLTAVIQLRELPKLWQARKLWFLCFATFAFFLSFRDRNPRSAFSHLGHRAEISHMNPRRNWSWSRPGNRAPVKRPLIAWQVEKKLPWVPEVFFSRATKSGQRPTRLRPKAEDTSGGSLFKTWPKPETAHEKPLAPKVKNVYCSPKHWNYFNNHVFCFYFFVGPV